VALCELYCVYVCACVEVFMCGKCVCVCARVSWCMCCVCVLSVVQATLVARLYVFQFVCMRGLVLQLCVRDGMCVSVCVVCVSVNVRCVDVYVCVCEAVYGCGV